jgi:hypothetical protein
MQNMLSIDFIRAFAVIKTKPYAEKAEWQDKVSNYQMNQSVNP